MVETYTPSLMQLTDGAVHKILSLKDVESDQDSTNLRVYVTGGGCSGFQYGFSFDNTIDEDDTSIAKKKLNEMCEKLLANLVIEDYSVEIE